MKGAIRKQFFKHGRDSNFRSTEYDTQPYNHMTQISMGEILLVQPEPAYKQHKIMCDLIMGGTLTSVAWPGPNMISGLSGTPSPAGGLHGLWEAPLPGQQVLVGYVDGKANDPVVIQKYPYNPSQNPIFEPAYLLPMTSKQHGPLDIVLGHFTESFMAFRGTLPVPGEIDIECSSILSMKSLAQMNMETKGTMEVSATTSFNLESSLIELTNLVNSFKIALNLLGIEIDATGGKITLKTDAPGIGAINIDPTGVTLGLGVGGPIACVGTNFVTTLLGPQPILPGVNLTSKA